MIEDMRQYVHGCVYVCMCKTEREIPEPVYIRVSEFISVSSCLRVWADKTAPPVPVGQAFECVVGEECGALLS